MFTDDPLADFAQHDAEKERRLAQMPICADCGNPVQEDHFYSINGEVICPDCMESNYRKDIDDYVE